jgi:hypothetical protein
MLFFGGGGYDLRLVPRTLLFSDVYKFWVEKFEVVGEYEVFVDVVVLFGCRFAPFVCVPSVVVVSLDVRLYSPCDNACISWSIIVFDVSKSVLYSVTADLILVTDLKMVWRDI